MTQKFAPSFTYNLTLLSSVKKKVEDGPNLCVLVRISELYDCDLPDVLEDSTWPTYGQYGPHRGPFCNA